jgi:hypothetical protein
MLVRAESPGYERGVESQQVVGVRVIDLQLSPLVLVRVRIDGTKASAPHLMLEFQELPKWRNAPKLMRPLQRSGADETWVARGVPSGTYQVQLRATGHAALDLGTHRLTDPSGHYLGRHRLRAGGTIRGTVTDREGGPVSGASVQIAALRRETTTDRGGAFRFENIPEGKHRLTAFGGERRVRRLRGWSRVMVRDGKTARTKITLR